MREVDDGLIHQAREGRSRRALPHWKTCYNFFRHFEADGAWDALVIALRVKVRTKLGRDPTSGEAWSRLGAIGGMLRRLEPDQRWNLAPFKYLKAPAVQTT